MTSTNHNTAPPNEVDFGQWDVDSLRVSIFCDSQNNHDPAALWQRVVDTIPESIESRPKQNLTLATGNLEDNRCILVAEKARLDWHIRPLAPVPPTSEGLLLVTDIDKMLPVLNKAVLRSIQNVQHVYRLAFGLVLIKQASSMEDALRQIEAYLPLEHLENCRDFAYQVNRRRTSRVIPFLPINRLTKWTVQEVLGSTVTIGPAAEEPVHTTKRTTVSMLTLDINNAPLGKPLPSQMPRLFNELVMLAGEIALKGDV